jgi:hypothetical protein
MFYSIAIGNQLNLNEFSWIGPYDIVSLAQIGEETTFEINQNGESQTVYLPNETKTIQGDNTAIIERMFSILLSAKEKKSGIWLKIGPQSEKNRIICFGIKLK